MEAHRALLVTVLSLGLVAACGSGSDGGNGGGSGGVGGSGGRGGAAGVGGDPTEFAPPPPSCAYECPGVAANCAEATTPYQCQNLGDWQKIPHASTCGAWDGSYPDPVQGKCTASAPTGEAALYAGPDPADATKRILPDGRRLAPAGKLSVFSEADLEGNFTTGIADVPGTALVLTVDTGSGKHDVRVVDTSAIGSANPVKSYVRFDGPDYLNSGVAFVPPDLVLVATANGKAQALTLDTATGQLTRDDTRSIALPDAGTSPYFVAGLAVSPDHTKLVVSGVNDSHVVVADLTPGATYGAELGEVDIGGDQTFGAYMDPNDASGRYAYVSMWRNAKVAEIDLADPTKPKLSRTFPTEHDPQGIAFLDGRWMGVANDLGESVSLVDRTSGSVTSEPVDYDHGLPGIDLSSLAYDAPRHRLYATLSSIDTLAALDVDLAKSPPALTPAGQLGTGWWPSGAVVHADGSLTVLSARGYGAGPVPDHTQERAQRGGVQQIAAPSASDLAVGEQAARQNVDVQAHAGYPKVTCPAGADDFPVPTTNTAGPSKQIDHIIFVVRENKTFDALFGDQPGVEGKASDTLKASAADMDKLWTNIRELARTFTNADNSYTEADASMQGHAWTVYGRTTDYCEREWGTHAMTIPGCGVTAVSKPDEGSMFDWLIANNVAFDILGEIVGNPAKLPADYNPIDARYPGGPFQSIGYPDIEKACYVAGRARVLCDLRNFVYMTLPNDHTQGTDPQTPTPETMIATNDEATGMLVDAISHSPLWKSSLIVITEDDPQQGADHVDYHRVPTVFISPWVKRGYVSKTHLSISGIHKIFAHLLGIPYPNVEVEDAALPYDLFTSTPDYTPYTYKPRQWPLACGDAATAAETALARSWQYDRADNQPGLDAQVMRWMRGQQLTRLTPGMRADIARRKARAASGVPDDDD